LKAWIVRVFTGVEEVEYEIYADRFFAKKLRKTPELMYVFLVGEEEVAHIFSPHYVCEKGVDVNQN